MTLGKAGYEDEMYEGSNLDGTRLGSSIGTH